MTDTMLFGVLKMPFEMAMKDEISRLQYYARVQELVGRFEAQQQAEPVQERITHITWDGRGVRTVNGIPDDSPQRKELFASEILNMMPSTIPAEYDGPLMEFARAVEAKLKEKNGY